MTIDIIQTVLEEFIKRLQLPESRYSFVMNTSTEYIELEILIDDVVKTSISIGNGSIRVIYTDGYDSDKYAVIKFITPITMLYYLCILFYNCIQNVSTMDFNDLLSVILLNEIYDWKTLVQGIAENTGMSFEKKDNFVKVDGIEIHYNGFVNELRIDTQEIKLKDSEYTTIVEAMFKSVEYIANVMGTADNLFNAENYAEQEEESNLLEEGGESMGGGMAPDMDMDIDVDMGGGEETGGNENPEPVEPMENETFEEPQGPVVTVDDLI